MKKIYKYMSFEVFANIFFIIVLMASLGISVLLSKTIENEYIVITIECILMLSYIPLLYVISKNTPEWK